jgi:hypothetical protein
LLTHLFEVFVAVIGMDRPCPRRAHQRFESRQTLTRTPNQLREPNTLAQFKLRSIPACAVLYQMDDDSVDTLTPANPHQSSDAHSVVMSMERLHAEHLI